jgi:hypothetical protein
MARLFTKNQDTAQHVQAAYANTKNTTQELLARARANAQSSLKPTRKATQNTLAKVQDSTKVGLDKAQDLLAAGVSVASAVGPLLSENRQKAQKKLKQAQVSLAKTAVPIVEKSQDVIVTSTKKAGKSLQKAADNTKDVKEALQDRYVHYQRKRRRNRVLFRIGLLAGIILALFYTPLTGSEVRQRIAQQWQRYRSYSEQ